jgi:hypothetical protein
VFIQDDAKIVINIFVHFCRDYVFKKGTHFTVNEEAEKVEFLITVFKDESVNSLLFEPYENFTSTCYIKNVHIFVLLLKLKLCIHETVQFNYHPIGLVFL